MANNRNAIVNTEPTVSETPADLVAEKAAPELSPNPAGFGFTKQVQVDSLPDSGAFDTLYLLRIYDVNGLVKDYYLYKWTYDRAAGADGGRTQPHWERVYNPINNVEHKDGEHATPVRENTAPTPAPEKVFKGDVIFNGNIIYKGKKIKNEDDVGSIVKANPTLGGTETELTGLDIDGVKYKVPQPIPPEDELPEFPDADGTYTLKCVVSAGVATLSWVADEPAEPAEPAQTAGTDEQ